MNEMNENLPLEGGTRKRLAVYTIVEPRGSTSGGNGSTAGTVNDKKWWVKIGAAFINRDQSINVFLDAMPTNGTLHIREPQPFEERGANGHGNGNGHANGSGAQRRHSASPF